MELREEASRSSQADNKLAEPIQASAQDTCGCQLIKFKNKDLQFIPCSKHNTVGDDYQIAKLKRMLKP